MVADIWEMAREMTLACEEIEKLRKLVNTQQTTIDQLRAELKDVGRTANAQHAQLEGEARETEKLKQELKRKNDELVKLQDQERFAMGPATIEIEALKLENTKLKESLERAQSSSEWNLSYKLLYQKERDEALENVEALNKDLDCYRRLVAQLQDFSAEQRTMGELSDDLAKIAADVDDVQISQRIRATKQALQFLALSFNDKDLLPEQIEDALGWSPQGDVKGGYPT